ncbi:hypothetical protein SSYM_0221, partial [Serratia symbiotica str. Tucson]
MKKIRLWQSDYYSLPITPSLRNRGSVNKLSFFWKVSSRL